MAPTNEQAIALLMALQQYRLQMFTIMICTFAGFFIFAQAAAMVMEVLSDGDGSDEDEEDVIGLTPLRRRRYYPRNRAKLVRTEPTAICLDTWDDARFRLELHVSKVIFDTVLRVIKSLANAVRKRSMSLS